MKRTIFFICIFHVVSALAFSSNANSIEKVINPPTEMNKLIIIGDGSDEGDLSIFLVAKIENPEKIENYELKVFTLFYIYSLQYIAAKDINMSNTVVFNKSEDEDMWNMTQAMPNTMVEITIDNEVSAYAG